MKPQSKLRGITPSALRDCLTYKFQFTLFLKFESHNKFLFVAGQNQQVQRLTANLSSFSER